MSFFFSLPVSVADGRALPKQNRSQSLRIHGIIERDEQGKLGNDWLPPASRLLKGKPGLGVAAMTAYFEERNRRERVPLYFIPLRIRKVRYISVMLQVGSQHDGDYGKPRSPYVLCGAPSKLSAEPRFGNTNCSYVRALREVDLRTLSETKQPCGSLVYVDVRTLSYGHW